MEAGELDDIVRVEILSLAVSAVGLGSSGIVTPSALASTSISWTNISSSSCDPTASKSMANALSLGVAGLE